MGDIVISIDAELAWGFRDLNRIPKERIQKARDGWIKLLNLLDKFDIPATWAVVGHLFLDECDGEHINHPSPKKSFSLDPGGDLANNPNWYGADLIKKIKSADVTHEIGSHSFSHMEFGNSYTTKKIANAELEFCKRLADKENIELDSFVFPRNSIGHRMELLKSEFKCYRGISPKLSFRSIPSESYGIQNTRRIRKLYSYISKNTSPPVVKPKIDEVGLVNIPASLFLFSFKHLSIPYTNYPQYDPIIEKVKLGLDKLKKSVNAAFHLWLHPNDITNRSDIHRLETVFRLLSNYAGTSGIEISTMGEVANGVL